MDADRLAAIPLFAALPPVELSALASVAGEKNLDAGTSLTTEGDFGHCIYAVEDGQGDVLLNGDKIGSVSRGDVVGEIAVLAAGRPKRDGRRDGANASDHVFQARRVGARAAGSAGLEATTRPP